LSFVTCEIGTPRDKAPVVAQILLENTVEKKWEKWRRATGRLEIENVFHDCHDGFAAAVSLSLEPFRRRLILRKHSICFPLVSAAAVRFEARQAAA
jgi:hypothetical protein